MLFEETTGHCSPSPWGLSFQGEPCAVSPRLWHPWVGNPWKHLSPAAASFYGALPISDWASYFNGLCLIPQAPPKSNTHKLLGPGFH